MEKLEVLDLLKRLAQEIEFQGLQNPQRISEVNIINAIEVFVAEESIEGHRD